MRLTTWLDILGLLLLVATGAATIIVLGWPVPLALFFSGCSILAISWIIDAKGARK